MAKSTVSRHSKATRKPVVIDLDPSDVKSVETSAAKSAGKPVPDAEPVGDPKPAVKPSVSPEPKSEAEAKPATPIPPQTASRPASSAGVSGPNPFASGKTMNSTASPTPQTKKTTSPWVAGLAGGVIVLLGTTVLQWAGLGLLPTQTNSRDEAAIAEIADLKQQIAGLQAATKPNADLLTRLEAAEKSAAETQQRLNAMPKVSEAPAGNDEAIRADVTALQEQLKALAGQAQPADSTLVSGLTERLNAMETKLNTIGSQAEQANAALNTDTDEVKALQQQLGALQTKIDAQATQPDMAAIIAANALKTAIDRGGSYLNELQTYKSLLPEQAGSVAGLDALAETGIPTLSQLNTQFASLADSMVAAVNKPAVDAGIWDQLVGSAKNLVRSRPIGDVAGSGVGPVIARIEFALQNGDVQRAMTEWAQLPEAAKQVGQSFYNALSARRDADALLAQLIAATAQPAQ
ncbi:hypothetical protein P8H26_06670 [Pseudochrobactrum sp. sp1633]|uniref:COG4223 family protein n=1 Tax=Pseudochrobactrum sp. sp1633 TaxID=3036706 RepID=UPI0025A619F4|nr:hypothetical protein [Pseudochrobactrum sp. sp1633]MDM8345073.1 hypothetical protein [Pseudochrobactrum sp. sp1633]HWD14906.1 hypothetical protein [Pseudochrobactrum sp.]